MDISEISCDPSCTFVFWEGDAMGVGHGESFWIVDALGDGHGELF